MVVISDSYYKEKNVKLTQIEIDTIIDELKRTEHNIFVFMDYEKIINKLEGKK